MNTENLEKMIKHFNKHGLNCYRLETDTLNDTSINIALDWMQWGGEQTMDVVFVENGIARDLPVVKTGLSAVLFVIGSPYALKDAYMVKSSVLNKIEDKERFSVEDLSASDYVYFSLYKICC